MRVLGTLRGRSDQELKISRYWACRVELCGSEPHVSRGFRAVGPGCVFAEEASGTVRVLAVWDEA